MKKIDQRDIRIGGLFEHTIVDSNNKTLLHPGERIDEEKFSLLLANSPIFLLSSEEEQKGSLPIDFLKAGREKMRSLAQETFMTGEVSREGIDYLYTFLTKAIEIIERPEHETLSFLNDTESPFDFLINHGINTAMITLAYSIATGDQRKDVLNLGLAAMLHDLGHLKSDIESLHEEVLAEYTNKDFFHHPHTGYEIIKKLDLPPVVAQSILFHHERIDGNGYPTNFPWEKLPLAPRIIAMADYFENYYSKSDFNNSDYTSVILEKMINHIDIYFDAAMLFRFLTVLRPFLFTAAQCSVAGHIVKTNLGEWAIVTQDTGLFLRPQISIVIDENHSLLARPLEINLRQDVTRQIVRIYSLEKSKEIIQQVEEKQEQVKKNKSISFEKYF